jgi:hypothetical protein
MGASNYLENEIIKHLFRTGSFTKPSALWVALFTVAPTDAGGGTEVSGGSYARVQRNPLDANWAEPAAGDGETSNVADITFPSATANWGTVVAFGIFDASTSGNMLVWATLAGSRTINSGDAPAKFSAGDLTVTVS